MGGVGGLLILASNGRANSVMLVEVTHDTRHD